MLSFAGSGEASTWEVGLNTSHWGLGMVANDGAHDRWFGTSYDGDRVVRARYTTAPLGAVAGAPLYTTVAFDHVYADDMADLLGERQGAIQGILSALHKGSDHELGVYGVMRHQRELVEGRSTHAGMVDVYADLPLLDIGDATLRLSGEGAVIAGRTDRATTYNSQEFVDVRSGGGVARLELQESDDLYTVRLQGGWASGDADPDSGVTSDFTFDRNFEVGSVLFNQFMAGVEVGTWGLLTDPQYSGSPPDGVNAVTTEGSFRRASFAQLAARVRPYTPIEDLELRAGVLMAWSTAPIAQPFYTYRAGGEPMTHHNVASTGTSLGTEVNWAISFSDDTVPQGGLISGLGVTLQGGHAFLSEDLAGEGDCRIDMVTMTVDASL